MMTNILRVRTQLNYGTGSPGLMTHYFASESGGYILNDAQLAVDRVRDAFEAGKGVLSTAQSWVISGEVDQLEDTNGEVSNKWGATERTGVGTAGAPLGPLPVGMLLRLRTDQFVGGRRLVGKSYFVPLSTFSTGQAAPREGEMAMVRAFGTSLLAEGFQSLHCVVWSRPREATEVGPHRPAGPARAARAGSSANVTSVNVSPRFVVLTSRRD